MDMNYMNEMKADGLTPHSLASLESELKSSPNTSLVLLRSLIQIVPSSLQGLNEKLESLVMEHAVKLDVHHMLVITQLLNNVSNTECAPPGGHWQGLITSMMRRATELVEASMPPEHSPSGRERWFHLGASTTYTVTAWIKFTEEMNTEILSVRDDDGVRVRLTLTDTHWVAESFGVQGHKVEKIGENLYPKPKDLVDGKTWRLVQVNHKRHLLRSASIRISIDNVLLPSLPCDYPQTSTPLILSVFPTFHYSSILISSGGLDRHVLNTLSPPHLIYDDVNAYKPLSATQSEAYNSAFYAHDQAKTEKYEGIGTVFGKIEYNESERGWEKGTNVDPLVDLLDGMVCSLPGSPFAPETINFLGAMLDKSMRAREWAIRQQLGIRLATAVRIGAIYNAGWTVPFKDSEHGSSAAQNVPSLVQIAIINFMTRVLKPADFDSPLATHKRLSDLALVPLQIVLSPELYAGSVTFGREVFGTIADAYGCGDGRGWIQRGDFLERIIGVRGLCDLIRLRCNWRTDLNDPSDFIHVASTCLTSMMISTLKAPRVHKGENACKVLVDVLNECNLGGVAGGVVVAVMKNLIEWEDEEVNRRFGQGLLLHNFHSVTGVCTLALINPPPQNQSLWVDQWKTLLCVYTWLSSAAGNLGSSCSRTLGTALIEVARAGKLGNVVDDFLVNYLFLGGPNSNINRLLSVLPILPALVASLTTPEVKPDMLTKFLAVAGVSLKSDFIAVEKVVGEDVGYLKYLLICVNEIETLINSKGTQEGVGERLRACEDLLLDATASLLVCSMRNGGASSTRSWREVVKGLKLGGGGNSLLVKLVGMALQRAARSEETPWKLDLKEGMSRLCLLVEEKRLLKLSQGRLVNRDEVKLCLAIVEVMRVGREGMGWSQVVVGQGVGAIAGSNTENESLLKILQPCLRIALGYLCNIKSGKSGVDEVVTATLQEIELSMHAALNGLAFAGARDVGLLVLANLRKSILCREAADDLATAKLYEELVEIVVIVLAKRHEIEKLTVDNERENEAVDIVEDIMMGGGGMSADSSESAGELSPRDAMKISGGIETETSLGWANYAGLGEALRECGEGASEASEKGSSNGKLEKLRAYLDAFDEVELREVEGELLDLFVAEGGESFAEGGRDGDEGQLTEPHIAPDVIQKYVEKGSAERERVAAVRNETMVQIRKQNVAMCCDWYKSVKAEMLEGGEECCLFERSVGDGGRDFYSRQVLFPVDQQFGKELPSYLDYEGGVEGGGSEMVEDGKNETGVEEKNGEMINSVEELGREIARKASIAIKNIASEEFLIEGEEDNGGKVGSEEGVGRPSEIVDAYANTENKEGGGGIDVQEYDGSGGGAAHVLSDGGMSCGGLGVVDNMFANCLHVRAAGSRVVTVFMSNSHLVLEYRENLFDGEALALEEARVRRMENSMTMGMDEKEAEEAEGDKYQPPYRTKALRYSISDFSQVYLRRYRLRDSGVEIFMCGGSGQELGSSSVFLDFGAGREGQSKRDHFCLVLMKRVRKGCYKQWPGMSLRRVLNDHNITNMWKEKKISNFDYIMYVNILAGRSLNDITQYPVFPWVLSNYVGETIDLEDEGNYRDLTKPMGALNEERLSDFLERYNSFVDNTIPPFMYGSHYSTAAGVVLHYNVRLHPFAALHRQLQGGNFDVSDRLFSSVARTFEMCTSALSEVKELTPEWFCGTGTFLKNVNNFNFGTMQDGVKVDDVVLPPWANGSPERFVEINRSALESDIVTKMLPDWIDLIFGYKQRGKAAVENNNVFFYLTYAGSVDVAAIEDPALRSATELQIAHFGQCPMQIFFKPHERQRTFRGGPNSLKDAIEPYSIPNAGSNGVLYKPFTGAPISHWYHLTPEPLALKVGYLAVRIISNNRIMAVDSTGTFHFYVFAWKMDTKNVQQQEARLRSDLMRISEIQKGEAAALAAQRQLSSDSHDSDSSARGSLSFDSALVDSMYDDIVPVNYDVGNFILEREKSGFKNLPRTPEMTPKVVAISYRLVDNLTVIVSDGGVGNISLQLVDVRGEVKNTHLIKGVLSGRAVKIGSDSESSIGEKEFFAVGGDDGAVLIFVITSDDLPKRPLHRISPLAHGGNEILGLAVSVSLRVVVSVSKKKVCVHSLVSGKLLRSWKGGDGDIGGGGVAISKLGYVIYHQFTKSGGGMIIMATIEGERLGELALSGVNNIFTVCGGTAVGVGCEGAKVRLFRVSAVKPFDEIDFWEVGGETENDLLGVGSSVAVQGVDFGPNRKISGYPSVVVVALSDGSIRLHALRGIGKWSQSVGISIASQVKEILEKPVGAIGVVGKTVLGGLGRAGLGIFGIGKEIINDVSAVGGEVIEEGRKKGAWWGK